MVDFARLNEEYTAFCATELGKLFVAYEDTTIRYWTANSDNRTAAREARAAFLAKLKELAK